MAMNYKKEYQRYMASPEWKELRAKARERAGNKCEFCSGPPDHVHHVKYPKRYQEDHMDNLVVACEACHEKLHGIRENIYVDDWIGTATGIILSNGIPRIPHIIMVFDPIPEEHRRPQPLKDLSRRSGDEIRNQFDGELFEEGVSYTKELPLNHCVFDGSNSESIEDMIGSILEYIENKKLAKGEEADLGIAFLEHFSVGPILCAFKKT